MQKVYREGPMGALMDEYEKAAEELKNVLTNIALEEYTAIADKETKDPDCVSIQTIMNHVVRSGYGYANYIRKQFGDNLIERNEYYEVSSPQLANQALDKMLLYTVETVDNKWNITEEEVMKHIIITRWGQRYDIEQLLEHAIVHILRHRRQIERFLQKLNFNRHI